MVVGLGYVGLPLAIALAEHYDTTGFDVDASRLVELRAGIDRTGEITTARLAESALTVTGDLEACRGAEVYIVAVPTPVDGSNRPDLGILMAATRSVAGMIVRGRRTLVIYESTVYPGVTEELCGPELERAGGLSRGVDFVLGYSPERINPGDQVHTIDRIAKLVSGEDADTLERVRAIYARLTTGGAIAVRSIKVAEAAKVIENAQRDINIAFINEITQIFAEVDISIWDVLAAARTKWNFLDFHPGLVGGHCIGVDPYYLAHLALARHHDPRVVLAGRAINDGMAAWVAGRLHERRARQPGSVLILGLTFKENVPDIRNSKVVDLVRGLESLGHRVEVHDPVASRSECAAEWGLTIADDVLERPYDVVVGAVAHQQYRDLSEQAIMRLVEPCGLLADLKGLWLQRPLAGISRWSL